jgi:hypothetical protein
LINQVVCVEDCEFEGDDASEEGGTIHMSEGKLIMNRTEVKSGHAGYAGAMYLQNVRVDLWLFCLFGLFWFILFDCLFEDELLFNVSGGGDNRELFI